jgi:hypothetical protein
MNFKVLCVLVLVFISTYNIFAGPPYDTDDPEPVEFHHWEFYVASHSTHDDVGWSCTLPHFEINYGVIENMQLHAIAPMACNFPGHSANMYGFGDAELGVKFRFVQEGKSRPMIGTFPLIEIPTGNQSRGLGNGKAQIYLPLWLQKSFGNWMTYGGAGYWINPGADKRNWTYVGWLLQRQFTEKLNIGVEIYHTTPQEMYGVHETRFNLGLVYDFTEHHHLLFSAGKGIQGPVKTQLYFSYQLTLGPKE